MASCGSRRQRGRLTQHPSEWRLPQQRRAAVVLVPAGHESRPLQHAACRFNNAHYQHNSAQDHAEQAKQAESAASPTWVEVDHRHLAPRQAQELLHAGAVGGLAGAGRAHNHLAPGEGIQLRGGRPAGTASGGRRSAVGGGGGGSLLQCTRRLAGALPTDPSTRLSLCCAAGPPNLVLRSEFALPLLRLRHLGYRKLLDRN